MICERCCRSWFGNANGDPPTQISMANVSGTASCQHVAINTPENADPPSCFPEDDKDWIKVAPEGESSQSVVSPPAVKAPVAKADPLVSSQSVEPASYDMAAFCKDDDHTKTPASTQSFVSASSSNTPAFCKDDDHTTSALVSGEEAPTSALVKPGGSNV
mmetsp:Transcript_116339/g.181812  ORF Transcript_116339/g.181812 Transcript_116339/m.181812 type:complete len:160 (-) Transcript_116339:50-529(-)